MLYLQILILLMLLIIEYKTSKKDIMHISFMSLASFLFALLLVAINTSWEYKMSSKAFFVILLTFLCIFGGEHFERRFLKKTKLRYTTIPLEKIRVSSVVYLISVIIMIVAAWIYILGVFLVGKNVLMSELSNGNIFSAYRYSAVQMGKSGTVTMRIVIVVLECISNSYLLLFIANKKQKKYLVPIFLYLIVAVFSTGRMSIIKFIIVALVLYYLIIARPKGQNRKFEINMVKVVVLGTIIFICLGMLTGKSGFYNSVFENISMYIASGIPAFDSSIQSARTGFTGISFWGLINLLSKFGLTFKIENNYLPYIYLPYMNHSTNIYTFLMRPYQDFGLIIMFLIFFLIAVIYTNIYIKIVNQSYRRYTFSLLLFSSVYYPVFMTFSDFRFSDILSITGAVQIIVYYLIAKKIDNQLRIIERK